MRILWPFCRESTGCGMVELVSVVGARPQFIKAAMLSRKLRNLPGIRERTIHTGQHYDENMSNVFFQELNIPGPDAYLGVGSGLHGAQTGRMLERVEEILVNWHPDLVLVYGDTNTTLAGALAAAKLHIPLVHVEAGLRSFNRKMPEEINRVVVDHISDVLFAPTKSSADQLVREGIEVRRIHVVGDLMFDAALHYAAEAERSGTILDRLGVHRGCYILVTVHRAENTLDSRRLAVLAEGLRSASRYKTVVWPLHPGTRKRLSALGIRLDTESDLRCIEPVGYLDMCLLEKCAAVIGTDSGGVQKEAYFHGVPCVVFREETEWMELVRMGWNRLAPPRSAEEISAAVLSATRPESMGGYPFGRGDAADRIARVIRTRFVEPLHGTKA